MQISSSVEEALPRVTCLPHIGPGCVQALQIDSSGIRHVEEMGRARGGSSPPFGTEIREDGIHEYETVREDNLVAPSRVDDRGSKAYGEQA